MIYDLINIFFLYLQNIHMYLYKHKHMSKYEDHSTYSKINYA